MVITNVERNIKGQVSNSSHVCINTTKWLPTIKYSFLGLWYRFLTHFENAQLSYYFLFVSHWDLSFCSYQMKIIIRVNIFLDSPSTFLPLQANRPESLQAKRTECSVSRTQTTPDQQYLILSTSHALTPGDTWSTTTTELTNRSLMGILTMLTMTYVKWKYMVRYCS